MALELRYTLTREELVEFFKYARRSSRLVTIVRWICVGGLAGGGILVLIRSVGVITTLLGCTNLLLSISVLLYCMSERSIIALRLLPGLFKDPNGHAFLAEIHTVLGTHGVHCQTIKMDATYEWRSIREVVRQRDAVYLMFDRSTGIILPDRVFGDAVNRDRTLAAIDMLRRESPPYPTHCPTCRYNLRGLARDGCPECGWRRYSEEAQS